MTTEEVLYLLDESLRKIIVKEEVIEKNNTGWVVYPPNTEADFPRIELICIQRRGVKVQSKGKPITTHPVRSSNARNVKRLRDCAARSSSFSNWLKRLAGPVPLRFPRFDSFEGTERIMHPSLNRQ